GAPPGLRPPGSQTRPGLPSGAVRASRTACERKTAMPSALTLGGLLLTLALHADAAPPDPLYTATVKVPEVRVRSGPSDDEKMYPTSRLHQGDKVEVVKERDDGWLEIKPPSGSFSWINTRFLERRNQWIWVVHTDDDTPVPVLVGSALLETKPTVS